MRHKRSVKLGLQAHVSRHLRTRKKRREGWAFDHPSLLCKLSQLAIFGLFSFSSANCLGRGFLSLSLVNGDMIALVRLEALECDAFALGLFLAAHDPHLPCSCAVLRIPSHATRLSEPENEYAVRTGRRLPHEVRVTVLTQTRLIAVICLECQGDGSLDTIYADGTLVPMIFVFSRRWLGAPWAKEAECFRHLSHHGARHCSKPDLL